MAAVCQVDSFGIYIIVLDQLVNYIISTVVVDSSIRSAEVVKPDAQFFEYFVKMMVVFLNEFTGSAVCLFGTDDYRCAVGI